MKDEVSSDRTLYPLRFIPLFFRFIPLFFRFIRPSVASVEHFLQRGAGLGGEPEEALANAGAVLPPARIPHLAADVVARV